MHKQQRLAPELKALMALSTEGHTGWIAKLGKGRKFAQNISASQCGAAFIQNKTQGPLEGL